MKKSIIRLISNVLFACLVINTLSASAPAHVKTLTPHELTSIRLEVDRDIKRIKTTVNRLKIAKNVVPVLILGIGVAVTAVITVLGAIFFKKLATPKIVEKLKNKIKKLQERIGTNEDLVEIFGTPRKIKQFTTLINLTISRSLKDADVADVNENLKLLLKLKELPQNLRTNLKKTYDIISDYMLSVSDPKKHFKFDQQQIKALSSSLKSLTTYIDTGDLKKLLTNAEIEAKKLKNKVSSSKKIQQTLSKMIPLLASVFMVLFGFLGTIGTTIFARIAFSQTSINKTADLVRKLEGLEKEFPGILTSNQKLVLAQFKKLAGDLTIQAILQNLELKGKLTSIVSALTQQNKALTKELGGAEAAKKELEKYFIRRLRKALLERNLDKADAKLKKLGIKATYNWAKRKVTRMEKKYPILKDATKNAVQQYIKKANKTFEKFNELLADAIVEGKITPETIEQPVPIISL